MPVSSIFDDMAGGMAAAEMVHHIVDKIEQLIDQHAGIDFVFFAKIDQTAIDAIAAGPPFVFVDQGAGILDIVHVLRTQLVYFHTDGLEEGGDADGLFHRHGHVADAELDRIEKRVHAEVPPDLLCVVDAIGLYQQLYEIVIGLDAFEIFGDAGTRESCRIPLCETICSRSACLPRKGSWC